MSAFRPKGITLVWVKPRRNILALKDFIQQYQADFADAVGKLHEAADGLETLFLSHKDAKRIKGNR